MSRTPYVDGFPRSILQDIRDSAIGNLIGDGSQREVYEWLPDDSLVAKIEVRAMCNLSKSGAKQRFQNAVEWETWDAAKGTRVAKWLAPCVWISQNGTVLLMKKTTPLDAPPKARMPGFLSDFKMDNYGMFDGRVVCHDYGTNIAIDWGIRAKARAPKW